jgi:hypothetical protein
VTRSTTENCNTDGEATKQPETYSWAVYHMRGTPAQFAGLVYDAPDEQSAIARAIEQHEVPEALHNRLIAQRRDLSPPYGWH